MSTRTETIIVVLACLIIWAGFIYIFTSFGS